MSTPIENFCNGLKALLACCIPNLKLKCDVLYLHKQRPEFDSNSDLMVVNKFVMAHSVHQTRLANSRVPNHNQLKYKLRLWAHSSRLH